MKFTDLSSTFSENAFRDMANALNTILRRIDTLNMAGEVVENITIPAGVEVEVSHSLKVVPKYRIILRNSGEFNIGDGDTAWTNRFIYLKNNGASDAVVSILILRS